MFAEPKAWLANVGVPEKAGLPEKVPLNVPPAMLVLLPLIVGEVRVALPLIVPVIVGEVYVALPDTVPVIAGLVSVLLVSVCVVDIPTRLAPPIVPAVIVAVAISTSPALPSKVSMAVPSFCVKIRSPLDHLLLTSVTTPGASAGVVTEGALEDVPIDGQPVIPKSITIASNAHRNGRSIFFFIFLPLYPGAGSPAPRFFLF